MAIKRLLIINIGWVFKMIKDKDTFEIKLAELIKEYRKLIDKNDMLDILESAHNSLEEDGEE